MIGSTFLIPSALHSTRHRKIKISKWNEERKISCCGLRLQVSPVCCTWEINLAGVRSFVLGRHDSLHVIDVRHA